MLDRLYKKRPCSNCPFRKDCQAGWLGRQRTAEICRDNSFTCHKTEEPNRQQCSGHMQVIDGNAFRQLAERLKYDIELSGRELLFDTAEDMQDHHDEGNYDA